MEFFSWAKCIVPCAVNILGISFNIRIYLVVLEFIADGTLQAYLDQKSFLYSIFNLILKFSLKLANAKNIFNNLDLIWVVTLSNSSAFPVMCDNGSVMILSEHSKHNEALYSLVSVSGLIDIFNLNDQKLQVNLN